MRNASASRTARSRATPTACPTATAPNGSHDEGSDSTSRTTGRQNIVEDTHADPSRSPANATRKFCTPAPAATTNISRSAVSRRSSPYVWEPSITRHGTTRYGALRSTSPRRTRLAIDSSLFPSRRRSSIHASRIASSNRVRDSADSSSTNRHGVV